MSQASYQIGHAVKALDSQPGSIGERLVYATEHYLFFANEDDLPDGEILDAYNSIVRRLTHRKEPYEQNRTGTVAYTVGETPENELHEIADDIRRLSKMLAEHEA